MHMHINNMNTKLYTLTKTAISLALLVLAQLIGSLLGANQFVTGSLVNLILIVAAANAGLYGGISVAVLSPVLAVLIGVGPKFIQLVPVIMVGNIVIVICMYFTYRLALKSDSVSWVLLPTGIIISALAKFLTLFLLVRLVKGVLLPNMPPVLVAMLSFPQLVTALFGGFLSIAVVLALKKTEQNLKS